jgi:hypothetical protein
MMWRVGIDDELGYFTVEGTYNPKPPYGCEFTITFTTTHEKITFTGNKQHIIASTFSVSLFLSSISISHSFSFPLGSFFDLSIGWRESSRGGVSCAVSTAWIVLLKSRWVFDFTRSSAPGRGAGARATSKFFRVTSETSCRVCRRGYVMLPH